MIGIEIKKPRAGEIYKCAFYEETVGTEIRGSRPVLIISENWYNEEGNRIIRFTFNPLF